MPSEKNIERTTVEELYSENKSGAFPLLMKIKHSDIVWKDSSQAQEDGCLRLINNNVPVMFKEEGSDVPKKYLPAYFSFEPPSEDGKKIGNTSVTISAMDQRVIEVIRSISSNPTAEFTAVYEKINDTEIMFSPIYHYIFEMRSVTWDGITAKWELVFDPAMGKTVPYDLATESRCPAAYEQNE